MSSHSNLLQESKESQEKQFRISSAYQRQITESIQAIIRNNSYNDEPTSLIDKITTIHQLDKEIDKQLNDRIAVSFKEMIDTKKQAQKLIDRCHSELNIKAPQPSIIDDFQRRSELIDQELRILENTLRLVRNRQEHEQN